jgi:dienelactone hydrolase
MQSIQKEVNILSEDITLAGTLSLPQNSQGKTLPAVLILPGARPWDRNGDIKDGIRYGHYKDIAEYLTSAGFIVLRYDKRGIGGSGGKFPPDDFLLTQDAEATYRWLREQPQVDKNRMIIIGHSQGTRIATLIAEKLEGLAAVVLLSPVLGSKAADYYQCPVLLVRGEKDTIVLPRQVDNLLQAFHNAGNKKCRSLLIPGANHLFFDVSRGEPDYSNPSATIHPMLLKEIVAWLREILKIREL